MSKPLTDAILAAIISVAGDAIICIDEAQRITFFNDGAIRIFGYSAEEVLGAPLDVLLPARFHARHAQHVVGFASSASSARRMGEREEIVGRRKGGAEFPAEAAIARVTTADGMVFSVVLRDVTDRRAVESVNEDLVSDLRVAVASRDEMLGIVSHDLRNPVHAVKMLAAAIIRTDQPDQLPSHVAEHAGVILQAANQMDTLIQDLLDVTHIESGRMQLAPQPTAVASLVSEATKTLAPIAEAGGVELGFAVSEPIPRVDVDPDRVAQVLSNLVGNAIKYTPRGGRVTVTAVRDRDDVRISVQDTGVGIAEEELPRVFDRFWQSKRTNRSGAGLGLTIARGIVRGHGGKTWIESKPGAGTTVHFTLPIAEQRGKKIPPVPDVANRGKS